MSCKKGKFMRRVSLYLLVIGVFGNFAVMNYIAADEVRNKPVKIYILAGQSNAEGRGNHNFLKENFPELAGQYDDIWHFRPKVKSPATFNGKGYGSYGVEFGAGLGVRQVVDNDLIFITSAVGGTMLYDRWLPPSAAKRLDSETGDLYNQLIKDVHNLIGNLDELYPRYKGQGYELAGFIWFQGENDCCANTQGLYRDSLMGLIKDVRTDLGVPNLPVVISKINDSCWGPPAVDIWAANEYLAHADENVVAINTRDMRVLCHYDSQSYLTIGRRVGKALQPFAKKTVHVGDADIRTAAKAFFARDAKPAVKQDMSSLEQGLVEYWKFDDPGNEIKSFVETGTDGTIWFGRGRQGKHGKPQMVAGKFGQALKLKSMNKIEFRDYKDPVNAKGEIEQMSLSFWARTTGADNIYRIGKGTGQKIETKSGHNWYWSRQANKEGWDLCGFDKGNLSFTGKTVVSDKAEIYSAWTNIGFCGDGVQWRHQVMVYDGIKKELRLYSNGQLSRIIRSTVVKPPEKPRKNAKPLPLSVEAGPLTTSKATLTIGGLEFATDQDFQVYDELAIWSRPLTEKEIGKLYNNGHGSEIIPANPLTEKSLSALRKIIKESPDAEARYEALRAAATKGDAATPLLIETLNDKSPGVRYVAAQLLGEQGVVMQDMALGLLTEADQERRVMGTVMLKYIGKKGVPAITVPALIPLLKDDHFDVRMNAADALAVLGDWAQAAVPALIKAAADEEWWVRRSVFMALVSINTPATRRAMIDIVTKERHAVMWFQDHALFMKHITPDPVLQKELSLAYGKWLIKEEGYYNTFGARGKFNSGITGLERLVKAKKPIPADVAKTIRLILKYKDSPHWTVDENTQNRALWPVDEKVQKRLEAILENINADKGAK